MRRFVLSAVLALAAAAVMAPAASAEDPVTVSNPGMFELEGDNQLQLEAHVPNVGEVVQLRCGNLWEANVTGTGAIDLHDIDLFPSATAPGSEGPCDTADDCEDEGWNGQIHEAEDVAGEFGVDIEFCLDLGDGIERHGLVECSISATEGHCDSAPDAETAGALEVDGEINVHGAGISIQH